MAIRFIGSFKSARSLKVSRLFAESIIQSVIVQPSILYPNNGAIDVGLTPTFESTQFTLSGDTSDTHVASIWEVYNASSTLIHTSSRDTDNLTSYSIPPGILETGSNNYSVRVLHEGQSIGESGFSELSSFTTVSSIETVGPATFTAFDASTDTGYYGEVLSPDLPTGDELASEIGLTDGVSVNSTFGWLKFHIGENAVCNRFGSAYDLFVSKRQFRNGASWQSIIDAAPTLDWNNQTYTVRMIHGANTSPTHGTGSGNDPANTHTSEWNHLIYRVHGDTPSSQAGANWANFSDVDLNMGESAHGQASWCVEQDQEVLGVNGAKVFRGYSDLSYYSAISATVTDPEVGWRPCLMVFV